MNYLLTKMERVLSRIQLPVADWLLGKSGVTVRVFAHEHCFVGCVIACEPCDPHQCWGLGGAECCEFCGWEDESGRCRGDAWCVHTCGC